MTTTAPTPAGHLTIDAADHAPAAGRRRVPFAVLVVAAMLSGLANTLLLVLVVFAGASDPVITGAGLVGLASGWALLAVLTTRWTDPRKKSGAEPFSLPVETVIPSSLASNRTTILFPARRGNRAHRTCRGARAIWRRSSSSS